MKYLNLTSLPWGMYKAEEINLQIFHFGRLLNRNQRLTKITQQRLLSTEGWPLRRNSKACSVPPHHPLSLLPGTVLPTLRSFHLFWWLTSYRGLNLRDLITQSVRTRVRSWVVRVREICCFFPLTLPCSGRAEEWNQQIFTDLNYLISDSGPDIKPRQPTQS